MSAFSAAINAIFRDPNMAVDGQYRAGGADPATLVRVIRSSPDVVSDWNQGRFVQSSHVFDVRVSDVALPAIGDTITIGGSLYSIREEPQKDSEGLLWKLGMRNGS